MGLVEWKRCSDETLRVEEDEEGKKKEKKKVKENKNKKNNIFFKIICVSHVFRPFNPLIIRHVIIVGGGECISCINKVSRSILYELFEMDEFHYHM